MGRDLLSIVGTRLGDTGDLPESLRKQLNSGKLDELESRVTRVLKQRYEGVANVDELMVGLYRDFEYVVEDRRAFSNKLYRMQKAGLIESVPKRKGVYSIPSTAEEDY